MMNRKSLALSPLASISSELEFSRPWIELRNSVDAGSVVYQRQLAVQCRYVVAFMALVGISTALLVNMLGQARIFTMAAREHLIPIFWAKVSPRYGTPVAAQITMGAASGQRSQFPNCLQVLML